MSVSVALSPQVDELHYVWDAWPALFPDLRFYLAIFNSSHPLFTNRYSFLLPFRVRSLSRACLLPGFEPRISRMRGSDLTHSATSTEKQDIV